MTSRPPVALFIFKRPDCTQRVLDAIRDAKPGRLYVVADGPRPGRADEAGLCQQVRTIVEQGIDWPCDVIRDYSPANLGCARRVSSGLDGVFAREETAIILEDDCIPDGSFFPYCIDLLERFRPDSRVGVIAGSNFQHNEVTDGMSYYFSRYPHCWGWATWRRAWRTYDHAMKAWPEAKQSGWLSRLFKNRREASYWERIFDDVQAGLIDSWAYRWTFACWQNEMLTVLPAVNLVANIGFGPAATHTHRSQLAGPGKVGRLEFPLRHPAGIERHVLADLHTYTHHFNPSRWRRWWRRLTQAGVSR
jgi:hypothetical protein